jgi:hypothetical protein
VVQLGAGSAHGGQWVPKKGEDFRYLGESGDINRFGDKETKIGSDGRAIKERHYNGNPKYHSIPHDHMITWGPSGNPITGPAINYWDGNIPEFKSYRKAFDDMYRIIKANSIEENAFESIADFQDCIRRGGEVVFTYNGKEYGIAPLVKRTPESDYQIVISEIGNDDSEAWYDDSEQLLDYEIDGKKLREIITQVTVTDRTI